MVVAAAIVLVCKVQKFNLFDEHFTEQRNLQNVSESTTQCAAPTKKMQTNYITI